MQSFIVYTVFAVCVVFVVWRIGRIFLSKDGKKDACSSCTADCKLRDLKSGKRDKCKK